MVRSRLVSRMTSRSPAGTVTEAGVKRIPSATTSTVVVCPVGATAPAPAPAEAPGRARLVATTSATTDPANGELRGGPEGALGRGAPADRQELGRSSSSRLGGGGS